ncbi:hypothetical protein FHG87_006453 [Trinorchestia longiramus]|nr:hypothetical protein FHG87_006453 [Trinorchestia longiramus]
MTRPVDNESQMFFIHPKQDIVLGPTKVTNFRHQLESTHRENMENKVKTIHPTKKENYLKPTVFAEVNNQLKSKYPASSEGQSEFTPPTVAGAEASSAIHAMYSSRPSPDLVEDEGRNLTLMFEHDAKTDQSSFVNDLKAADSASVFSRTLTSLLYSLNLIDSPTATSSHLPVEGKIISVSAMPSETNPEPQRHLGIAEGVAAVLALLAAVSAGVATLIAFVVPPLQIANQVLAVIAVALFIAYIFEDKHYIPKEYFEQEYYDYDDFDLQEYYVNTGYVPDTDNSLSSSYSLGYSQPNHGYQQQDRGKYQSTHNHTKSTQSGSSQYNQVYRRESSSHPAIVSKAQVFDKSTTDESLYFHSRMPTISEARNEVQSSNRGPTLQHSDYALPVKTVTDNEKQVPIVVENNTYATMNSYDVPNTNVSLDTTFVVQSRQGDHSALHVQETTAHNPEYIEQHQDSTRSTFTETTTDEINEEEEEPTPEDGVTADAENTTSTPNTKPHVHTSSIFHFGRLGRPRSLWHRSRVPRSVMFDVSGKARTAISKFSSLYDQ